MSRAVILIICAAALGFATPATPAGPAGASLVPIPGQIGDQEARLALARLLAADDAGREEAAALFARLLAREPDRAEARLEWAGVLERLGRREEAGRQRAAALAVRPDDAALLLVAAEQEAGAGHAAASRALFARALGRLAPGEAHAAAELRLAAAANLWGAFNLAEAIQRRALAPSPDDPALRLALAATLAGAQRHDQAEREYRLLLWERPGLPAALAGLARLKYGQGDFMACLAWCDQLAAAEPASGQGRELRALCLLALGRHQEAAEAYGALEDVAASLTGRGRVDLARGRQDAARGRFQEAVRRAPSDLAARFWLSLAEEEDPGQALARLIAADASPLELVRWGELNAEQGRRGPAIASQRAALARDPACFPAAMALAETLAADRRYEEALAELARLEEATPGNRKVLLTRARVLSWARDYEGSLAAYAELQARNPADSLPTLEAARVAAWGKQMERAQALYARLAQPAVDQRLAARLRGWALELGGSDREAVERLAGLAAAGGDYRGYERVEEARPGWGLTPGAARRLEGMLLELGDEHGLQKTVLLEGGAKLAAWNRRLLQSRAGYRELVDFRPGDLEARFDLAQVQCALGLGDCARRAYRELLAVDPWHPQAREALARQEAAERPALAGGYWHWREAGYGQLAQMTRSRADLGLEVPLGGRLRLTVTGHRWREAPHDGASAEAWGPSLALEGQVSPALRAGLAWTHKDYRRSDLADRDNGRAEFWYRAGDYGQLGAGFTREDHLSNAFALAQGIQRDSWWVGWAGEPARDWELAGRAAWLDYSDGNHGRHFQLSLGRALTEHPRQLKAALRADYRDTDQADQYRYDGSRLVDITHPYWSPRDNLAGALVVGWRHDLAGQLFCGAPRHHYDLSLSLGNDTENNPSAALEAKWVYEFADRWTAEAQGLVHRSREWDAEAFWLRLAYRF